MAKSPACDLTDVVKRDLVQLIQAGKRLPEKYRFILFGSAPQLGADHAARKAEHSYERPGRYTVAVKVVDIFGNDTMTLLPVTVG